MQGTAALWVNQNLFAKERVSMEAVIVITLAKGKSEYAPD